MGVGLFVLRMGLGSLSKVLLPEVALTIIAPMFKKRALSCSVSRGMMGGGGKMGMGLKRDGIYSIRRGVRLYRRVGHVWGLWRLDFRIEGWWKGGWKLSRRGRCPMAVGSRRGWRGVIMGLCKFIFFFFLGRDEEEGFLVKGLGRGVLIGVGGGYSQCTNTTSVLERLEGGRDTWKN